MLIKVIMNLFLKKIQDAPELLFILVNLEVLEKNATVSQWDHFDKGYFYFWYFS